MKISYYITTHNEGQYVWDILEQLVPHCRHTGDEIVVLDDHSDDRTTLDAFKWMIEQTDVRTCVAVSKFQGDFAAHKNVGHGYCRGDYIFQLDADELLQDELLSSVTEIVESNPEVDLYYVPRINIVNGLTEEDIKRWNWRVSHQGWVMFPDYQGRLYKNLPHIKWEGKVHERIVGHKALTALPPEEEYAIIHVKEIDRQRKQNEFYNTL
jgi:glycosyltransferase involved in cell wall biosynthesis